MIEQLFRLSEDSEFPWARNSFVKVLTCSRKGDNWELETISPFPKQMKHIQDVLTAVWNQKPQDQKVSPVFYLKNQESEKPGSLTILDLNLRILMLKFFLNAEHI